jgi:hypothetical protein
MRVGSSALRRWCALLKARYDFLARPNLLTCSVDGLRAVSRRNVTLLNSGIPESRLFVRLDGFTTSEKSIALY